METKFSVNLLTNLQVSMDKKTSKDAEKKTERVKDRGDLKKNIIMKAREGIVSKDFMPDRGDSQYSNQKSVPKPSGDKKKPEDAKRNSEVVSKKEPNKKEVVPAQVKTYLDLEGRKRLRERYTLKLNSQNLSKNSEVKVETKDNDIKIDKKTDDESTAATGGESSKNSVYTEPRSEKKLAKETPCTQRKPIIKTVTIKNDNRVYKAVTFVDQKQHTPLQINIPNEYKKKTKEPTYKVKLKPSKESVCVSVKPVKKVKKRGKNGKKRILSPELFTRGKSPQTEVAKWAPSCINHHTKPYYEAWVDTTLAAISKASNKDRHYLEKQNLIHTFHRALLERPDTPDLMYENYNDERYTGKIKIRQR